MRQYDPLQQVLPALAVRLPIAEEPEHRLEQRLHLESRPDLGDEVRHLLPLGPKGMPRPRRRHRGLPRRRPRLFPIAPQRERPRPRYEPPLDVAVDVQETRLAPG